MNAPAAPLVSIVIPHWNAGKRTLVCLDQFQKWDYPRDRLDILVLDNGSTDGSSQPLAEQVDALRAQGLPIRYHRFDQHPGLTASLTQSLALTQADSVYLLRLDNDVDMNADALSVMVSLMQARPDIGVTGPRLVYASAPDRLNGGAVWLSPWGGRNRMEDPDQPVECDTLLGATMLFRRSALQEVGRWFDPGLYLFAEEPEVCWQLRRRGYATVFVPQALGRHDTAQSTGKHSALSNYLNYRNHTLVYARMYPGRVALLRNLHVFPRILARCWRERTTIPFWGFMDGLLARPLNDAWWQEMISAKAFRRP
ncbi:MAG: glycosyltransferase family 2 protein [Pseudomonadota bacterium]